MVKLQIVSDLHIEVEDTVPPALSLITPSADILVLAGDIGRINKPEQLKAFLTDICQHYQYVLYVLGNHEYYKVKETPNRTMEELFTNLSSFTQDIPNLHILNRNSVVIDNTCIIGCTLWSRALVDIPSYMVRIHAINTTEYNELHKQDLKYIEKMVAYCNYKNLKLVVITHHCPTYLVIGNRGKDRFRSLYASNLDYLLDSNRIHTWICGHTHTNFDLRSRNGTRVVSNQKGKPRDNITDFSLSKIINV
jgi:predicted phosphodiesterase